MSSPGFGQAVRWRSRTTFVLALSASAVGLGNLWRFSYLSGENGGAAFFVTYILCLFLIAVPVMIAEVVIGSQGRAGPLLSVRRAADRSLLSRAWMWLGVLACLTGLLILAFYIVVAGWAMAYARFMHLGVFAAAPALEVGQHFGRFVSEPMQQLYWQSLFLLVTLGVLVLGVRRGLGMLVWLAVPALLALLAYLILFGLEHGDMEATRRFLFTTRLMDFSPQAALVALGHAFYTLGVGVGTGISYGAYAPERIPIGRTVLSVAVFDTMIAVFAGLAIFPIVFANNMEPAMGPGLLFVSLPYAFGNLGQGELFGTLFFLLVTLAALGSAVAIMEPIISAVMQFARVERLTAAILAGGAVWLLSLAVVLSLTAEGPGNWYGNRNLFQFLDSLTAVVLLPLVSFLTAVFVGWRMKPELLRTYFTRESAAFFGQWRFLLRYIAVPAIVCLLLAPLF
ncbi:MAG: sodium-dependent transporter [Halioglobus sp.]